MAQISLIDANGIWQLRCRWILIDNRRQESVKIWRLRLKFIIAHPFNLYNL